MDDNDHQIFIDLCLKNTPIKEIASRFKISKSRVSILKKRYGLQGEPKYTPQSTIDEIIRLRKQGYLLKQISKELNISVPTISKYTKNLKRPPREQKPRQKTPKKPEAKKEFFYQPRDPAEVAAEFLRVYR